MIAAVLWWLSELNSAPSGCPLEPVAAGYVAGGSCTRDEQRQTE